MASRPERGTARGPSRRGASPRGVQARTGHGLQACTRRSATALNQGPSDQAVHLEVAPGGEPRSGWRSWTIMRWCAKGPCSSSSKKQTSSAGGLVDAVRAVAHGLVVLDAAVPARLGRSHRRGRDCSSPSSTGRRTFVSRPVLPGHPGDGGPARRASPPRRPPRLGRGQGPSCRYPRSLARRARRHATVRLGPGRLTASGLGATLLWLADLLLPPRQGRATSEATTLALADAVSPISGTQVSPNAWGTRVSRRRRSGSREPKPATARAPRPSLSQPCTQQRSVATGASPAGRALESEDALEAPLPG